MSDVNQTPRLIGIAAMNEERCIGKNNQIPWHYKEDFQHFKKTTLNGTIIMGRKTWDSLPKKPLPKRRHIVLTSNPERFAGHDFNDTFFTKLEGLDEILVDSPRPFFSVGGAEIYKALWDRTDEFLITVVKDSVEDGDAFFPEALFKDFKLEESSDISESCQLRKYIRI